MLEVNDAIRELINQGAPDSTIRIAAVDMGMRTLPEDGIEKVLAGVTTLEEVNRVVYLAEENRRLCPFCTCVLAGEFDYCPSCGHFVGDSCVQCHRKLNGHWDSARSAARPTARTGPEPAARARRNAGDGGGEAAANNPPRRWSRARSPSACSGREPARRSPRAGPVVSTNKSPTLPDAPGSGHRGRGGADLGDTSVR